MIQTPQDTTSVRHAQGAWLAAFNAGDIETLFSFYDPESVYASGGEPLMDGLDEIRRRYETVLPNDLGTLHFREESAFQDGSLAMLVGAYHFTSTERPSSEVRLTGRVSLTYRCDAGREWLHAATNFVHGFCAFRSASQHVRLRLDLSPASDVAARECRLDELHSAEMCL